MLHAATCADCTHRHTVVLDAVADDLQAPCLQTELAQLQLEQQKLRKEQPVPAERLMMLEDSIAELSAATEQQSCQLSDTQKVSVHCTSCHIHYCHSTNMLHDTAAIVQ